MSKKFEIPTDVSVSVELGTISFRIHDGGMDVVMWKIKEDGCGAFLKTLGTIPNKKLAQLFRTINANRQYVKDPKNPVME